MSSIAGCLLRQENARPVEYTDVFRIWTYSLKELSTQKIQDRYFSIYEREIDDTEWDEINGGIQRHFREYDALVNPGAKGSEAAVKSVRRALPTPFVPGLSSNSSEPQSSSVIQTNGGVASDRSSFDRR